MGKMFKKIGLWCIVFRVRNKNAPLLRMAAIGSYFVFGKKGAQRAAEGTSPRLFCLHPRRCRFRSSSLRGSFLLRTLSIILIVRQAEAQEVKDTRPHLWSIGIVEGATPLSMRELPGAPNPRLTTSDLPQPRSSFVADPFLVREHGVFYLFFELFNAESQRGEIGVASSTDGYSWRYRGVGLKEAFHLSYPYVFKHKGNYYMIPESRAGGGVRLYRAKNFPLIWEFDTALFEGPYADSSIVYRDNQWWIFSELQAYKLTIWHSPRLQGPWRQHPMSPLYVDDRSRTRPGGRIVDIEGKLVRFSQDNVGGYGKRVRAFEITELTATSFRERPLAPDPLFQPTGNAWRFNGMHHVSPLQLDNGRWIAAVDGNGIPTADRAE